jgi:hypothetical protein
MENFARRGIRTTVAVAGLAALGVGLAAPTAFALPSVPDISGVGNTQAVPSPTDAAAPAGALPSPFQFTPPAAEQYTSTDAAPSSRVAAEPTDEESTEPGEARDSGETTEADESEAGEADPAESTESTEAAPAATTPAPTTQGLLPSIPGSPVAAQASPQVAGVDPSSALQSLDSGSMF